MFWVVKKVLVWVKKAFPLLPAYDPPLSVDEFSLLPPRAKLDAVLETGVTIAPGS